MEAQEGSGPPVKWKLAPVFSQIPLLRSSTNCCSNACVPLTIQPCLLTHMHALGQLPIFKAMQGLREFPSSVIVPMMQISWTMFSILSGGIYFHEYRVFTAFTGTMFAVGVAVTGPAPPPCSTAWLSPARPCIVQSTGKQAGLANGQASAAGAAARGGRFVPMLSPVNGHQPALALSGACQLVVLLATQWCQHVYRGSLSTRDHNFSKCVAMTPGRAQSIPQLTPHPLHASSPLSPHSPDAAAGRWCAWECSS